MDIPNKHHFRFLPDALDFQLASASVPYFLSSPLFTSRLTGNKFWASLGAQLLLLLFHFYLLPLFKEEAVSSGKREMGFCQTLFLWFRPYM